MSRGSLTPRDETQVPSKEELTSLNEDVLADDYPIYGGYLYVADGKVIASNWHGISAREFKCREGIAELRRCDIVGRRRLTKAGG